MKLKTATALMVLSLMVFLSSLAAAQRRPEIPGVVRPNAIMVPPAVARPVVPPGMTGPPPAVTATPAPSANPQGGSAASGTTPAGTPPAAGTPAAPGTRTGGRTVPGNITEAGGNLHEFQGGIDYSPLPAGARITFNLQDADLPDLVRAIGNITGRRFIIGSKVRAIKATIYSPTKVTPSEAYQAFLSVLDTNGMTVIPAGRYLKIEESTGVATRPVPAYSPAEGAPDGDRFVTRIHRLRNMGAEEASQVLGHFKSRDGDITVHAATNTLIITDTGTNIRRMMQILSEVDVPSVGEQIWVERVHHASPTELAQRITELLGQQAAARPGQPAAPTDTRLTRILADERSSSLIIMATERMYLRVLELIRRLDVEVEGEGELRVHYLQHADADELAGTLNTITGGGRTGATAPGQNRAAQSIFEGPIRITAEKRTNSLIINSSPRDFASVRRVIQELDRPRRQVFIEAVVMELTVGNGTNMGGALHFPLPFSNPREWLGLGGFRPLNSLFFPAGLATDQNALSAFALGVRGPYVGGTENIIPGLSLGIPGFGAVITALANTSDTDVLGTPSIIAMDGEPADISVGENIPLQTGLGAGVPGIPGAAGAAGAAGLGALGGLGFGFGGGFSAPRSDVGIKIHVVPRINASNQIRMEIEEEISDVVASNQGALGAVSIGKRTAKTKVVVQDQQTVVIGGLIRNAVSRRNTRVPFLGDLPIIGFLFRQEERSVQRRNLLLFLTPYIVRDQSDLRRIFERKMRERQEFLDRYMVFAESSDYQPPQDFSRTNGLVEEIRQSIRTLREQSEIEARAIPRAPPEHVPLEPIELPAEVRTGRSAASPRPTTGPPATAPPPMQPGDSRLPIAVPVSPSPVPQ